MELSQEMLDALDVFRREWGDTEYEYYAIPVSYRSGKRGQSGTHYRPATDLERFICTKEKYEQEMEHSKSVATKAFMGNYKASYIDYQRRVKVAGWREKLIEYLKAE